MIVVTNMEKPPIPLKHAINTSVQITNATVNDIILLERAEKLLSPECLQNYLWWTNGKDQVLTDTIRQISDALNTKITVEKTIGSLVANTNIFKHSGNEDHIISAGTAIQVLFWDLVGMRILISDKNTVGWVPSSSISHIVCTYSILTMIGAYDTISN